MHASSLGVPFHTWRVFFLLCARKKWSGVSAGPRKVSRNLYLSSTPPAVICVTIPASDRNPILQQYQHQPTGSPAQWGWLQDYCRNSSIRLSLSHTHIPLCTHTHAPGHITPAFNPLYLILSNSSIHSLFIYFSFYSGSSIQSHPPYLIPAVSLMHGLYTSWDFQKYRLSGPETSLRAGRHFGESSGGKYRLNMTQVLSHALL